MACKADEAPWASPRQDRCTRDPTIVEMNDAAALARWRSTEQAMERGLDPEIRKRLDALRLEDARLLRRHPIRPLDPAARFQDPLLRRTG